jgi:hypothetical protein
VGGAGTLIASRRPANPIGWLFSVGSLLLVCTLFAHEYGRRADLGSGSLPGAEVFMWLQSWLWAPPLGAIAIFAFLLFPDGRLPAGRWRPLALFAAGSLALLVPIFALQPGPLQDFPDHQNPFGLEVLAGVLHAAQFVAFALFVIAIAASAASLPVRLRRARGEERQQLKWFAYAAIMAGIVIAVVGPFWETYPALRVLVGAAFAALALAIGSAILRYRLYDIDVVINRTLVYGSVTAVLAGAYLGLVLVFQLVFRPLTEENSLAVAVSTLAVAALFRPARNRVQALVDRRFYRRRYDAQRTLESFASRLREEVDLDALRAELTGVVAETMQPSHVSLWVRSWGAKV